MTEPTKSAEQAKIDAETCDIHRTPLVKHQVHVGDGKVEWSVPYCPLCEELKANGKYDEVAAAARAEQGSTIPVTRTAAPAAKP